MQSLLEVVNYGTPVSLSTPGGNVYDRFEREIDTMAVAVVDEADRPIGLIERNAFMLKVSSQYGRALYMRRAAALLMDRDPIVVDSGADPTQFTRTALSDRPSDLLKGFIVTVEGRYAGVGSTLSLLKMANNANLRHLHTVEGELKARDQLLSVMSHEIRTPLNGVLSVAEIINHELTQEELRPHVRAIIDSGGLLLRLMNDSLDFFRGEGGVLDLHEDSFDVTRLLDDAGALWKARAVQANLGLELAYDGPDDIWALGDTIRIKQIFNNLIGNALKFASQGGREGHAQRQLLWTIMWSWPVSWPTRGPAFPRTSSPPSSTPTPRPMAGRSHGGAGLGLAVCRQLVEKMSGSIRCESRLGEGAQFHFNLILFAVPAPWWRSKSRRTRSAAAPCMC